MKVERISNLTAMRQGDWEDLLIQSGNKSLFMTWIWLTTWWEVYGADHELWWLNVKDNDGSLMGSAPLYLRRHRNGLILPHRELRFIGTGAPVSPEHLDILAAPGKSAIVLPAINDFLSEQAEDWDVLLLTDLTDKEGSGTALELRPVEDQFPMAPYIPLPASWEEYFKSLGKWLRRTITRQRNKQTREMEMSFQVWSPKQESFESAFTKFEKLYALRKESMKVENKFEVSAGYRKFHRLLAFRFSAKGWLNLAFLKIGTREVACEYTFKYRDALYSYQSGFDPEFGKNNVFKVLRSYVIENAIQQGVKEFDLLRGEEAYKYDWKAIARKKQSVRRFSPNAHGRVLYQAARLKRLGSRVREMVTGAAK